MMQTVRSMPRVASLWLIALAAVAALACGPTGDSTAPADVIAPADERPSDLDSWLDLPPDVDEVSFPWSEVTVLRDAGRLTLNVLVADTPERRSRGLMYWTGLPPETGMIFIWEETRSRRAGFWNQNVPIDLDVAWLDVDGTVLEFSTLWAGDETIRRPQAEYFFVLETPRGRLAELDIGIGDRVVIPSTLLPAERP